MYFFNEKKEDCTGCRACVDICPKNSISMKEDEEGFLYPVIDDTTCIQCHLCKKVCPFGYDNFTENDVDVYVGVHNSENIVHKSSSGGAFSAIYEHLLNLDYSIYGVKFDDTFKVKHFMAKTTEDCEAFRKSKYVLSDTDHCYTKIQNQLNNGENVLFSGTPCQCAGLLRFLELKKTDTQHLLTIDLVCHGVPNQALFDSYLSELECAEKSTVKNFSFKNKTPINGNINSRSAKISFSNDKTKYVSAKDDPFLKAYYSRLFYRPSCGKCPFARIQRTSDLTLGDAWGIEQLYPQYNPLVGTSLILANSIKGKTIVEQIKNTMTLLPATVDWAKRSNQQLQKPTEFHKNRKKFFLKWKEYGFSRAVKIATKQTFIQKALKKVKHLVANKMK